MTEATMKYVYNLILYSGLVLFLIPGYGYCAPKVKVDNPVYNAGEVPQGKQISHEFVIENSGDETLTIIVKPC